MEMKKGEMEMNKEMTMRMKGMKMNLKSCGNGAILTVLITE